MKSRVFRFLYRVHKKLEQKFVEFELQDFVEEVSARRNITILEGVVFTSVPFINLHPESSIIIGERALINAKASWLHVAAYSAVHLLADRPGARIEIGADTRFHASCIRAYQLVKIGARCLIANNCQIMDGSGHGLSFDDVSKRIEQIPFKIAPVEICDDVWLCEGVTVLPGVRIGRGTIVGARSVVTKSLPPMCLAAGNPARVVRDFTR